MQMTLFAAICWWFLRELTTVATRAIKKRKKGLSLIWIFKKAMINDSWDFSSLLKDANFCRSFFDILHKKKNKDGDN